MLNKGMRAGIPSNSIRARTITLYLDKQEFNKSLGIDNEQNIWLYLFNKPGEVLWRTEGRVTDEKRSGLRKAIEDVSLSSQ
jgi:hypothetical protein